MKLLTITLLMLVSTMASAKSITINCFGTGIYDFQQKEVTLDWNENDPRIILKETKNQTLEISLDKTTVNGPRFMNITIINRLNNRLVSSKSINSSLADNINYSESKYTSNGDSSSLIICIPKK